MPFITDPHPVDAYSANIVRLIELTLERRFDAISLENGGSVHDLPNARADYLLYLSSSDEAKRIAQAMQCRGVASGVRRELNSVVLRVSREDLIAAFRFPESHLHDGVTAWQWLEEAAMLTVFAEASAEAMAC